MPAHTRVQESNRPDARHARLVAAARETLITMKPVLKLAFSDFWPNFDPADNYFTDLLSERYTVVLRREPDLLIFSNWGFDYETYSCRRVFYTGENRRPDFSICDYAFSFDHIDHPRHYRLPLYALYTQPSALVKGATYNPDAVIKDKLRFCNFVVSNPDCPERIEFFHMLSDYKKVDSGGRLLNNVGGPVRDKRAFMASYKFTIAFENQRYPGYTTEKIVEPMLVDILHIYWGNPMVDLDFNTKSFINFGDHRTFESMIDEVIAIDKDPDLHRAYLSQPWFKDDRVNEYVDPANVLDQFARIIDEPIRPVATHRRIHRTARKILRRFRTMGSTG